jgi:HD-GYP domain-containing protein (c-di-GMP phosphodiesterase class II)
MNYGVGSLKTGNIGISEVEIELLDGPFHEFIEAMTMAIDARDRYTAMHSYRVGELNEMLAERMTLSKTASSWLHIAGHLHDIGKIGIRDSVLLKPGRLTEEEYREMKLHPIIGADIVRKVSGLSTTVEPILYHHERLDGSGYPYGLVGDDIPRSARITAVSDSLDAMLSVRPYRKAFSVDAALGEFQKNSNILYDPEVVEALLSIEIEKILRLYG